MFCRECGKQRYWRRTGKTQNGLQILRCTNCENEQEQERPQGLKSPPSVLYFDIETALVKTTVFNSGRQWVRWQDVESDPFVLCWAAVWMNKGTKIISDCITPEKVIQQDDSEVLRGLYELMKQADYIVGHNMRPYDWKMVSGRFFTLGWDAPLDSAIVDTLSLSRKRFRVLSHSLESWLQRKGYGGKTPMERKDWQECIRGDEKALDKMHRYCRKDVRKGALLTLDFQRYVEQATGKLLFR